MAQLRLFASLREAAGASVIEIDGSSARQVIDLAAQRFGAAFSALLPACAVMVDGELVRDLDTAVRSTTEVALLPPVSGGAT